MLLMSNKPGRGRTLAANAYIGILAFGAVLLDASAVRSDTDKTVLYQGNDWYVSELVGDRRHQCQLTAINRTGTSFSITAMTSTQKGVSISLKDKNFKLTDGTSYSLTLRIDGRRFGPYPFTAYPQDDAIHSLVRYGEDLATLMAAVQQGDTLTVVRQNGYEVATWSLAASYQPFERWRTCAERIVGVDQGR